MNFNRVVCFDLEMCCWNVDGKGTTGEIIEIGLAEIDLAKQEIVKRAQYYVKPEKDEVSLFCTELTGITPRKIEKQGEITNPFMDHANWCCDATFKRRK